MFFSEIYENLTKKVQGWQNVEKKNTKQNGWITMATTGDNYMRKKNHAVVSLLVS